MGELTLPVRPEDLPLLRAGSYFCDHSMAATLLGYFGHPVTFVDAFPPHETLAQARIRGLTGGNGGMYLVDLDELFLSTKSTTLGPPPKASDYFPTLAEPVVAGFEEAPRSGLESLREATNAVRRSYGFRCCISHFPFSEATSQEDGLEVVSIRSVGSGGSFEVTNLLPMALPFVRPFKDGGIAIGQEYAIYSSSALVHPDVRKAIHTSGRLFVPDDPAFRPDPAALAWHAQRALRMAKGP